MDSVSTIIARGSALLTVRDGSSTIPMSTSMIDLLIALMVLVFLALVLIGALYVVRKIRRNKAVARQQLPMYNEQPLRGHQRNLTITTPPYRGHGRNSSIFIIADEKDSVLNSPTTPLTPESVPEIRITFPDEQDEAGKRKSGRVVLVRVGETGIGLEPLADDEEQLPAYEKESKKRFRSIDMDRIGGLKEKESWS